MIIPKNILVVDDDLQSLHAIVQSLHNETEYSVFQSNNVNDAFIILEHETVNLIITDWEMPDTNGYEFTLLLKENQKTSRIPVIMATGKYTSKDDMQKAFDAGVIDFIRKPFDAVELNLRIKAVLKLIDYQQLLIQDKNKQISENSLLIIKNNEFIESIIKKLEEIEPNVPRNKKKINEIITEIRQKVQADSWTRFEITFETVYAGFSRRLINKFPNLSKSEVRLAILVVAGLPIKDIANLLYKTPDSVKTARHRLRQKFNLDSEKSLYAFLTTI